MSQRSDKNPGRVPGPSRDGLRWALFTVHNAGDAELDHVREGLDHASGYFRHAIARRLRLKVTPALSFEVDRVFEQATRVEQLLQEIASETGGAAAASDADKTEE